MTENLPFLAKLRQEPGFFEFTKILESNVEKLHAQLESCEDMLEVKAAQGQIHAFKWILKFFAHDIDAMMELNQQDRKNADPANG